MEAWGQNRMKSKRAAGADPKVEFNGHSILGELGDLVCTDDTLEIIGKFINLYAQSGADLSGDVQRLSR